MTTPATSTAFSYRALGADGRIASGTLAVESRAEALAALERRGLLAVDLTAISAAARARPAIPASDLALGLRMLAELLEAGLSVNKALSALTDLVPRSWSTVLPDLQRSIREGKSLGAALRDAPAEIPALVVGMTLAGEMSGEAGLAVRRAADVMESASETHAAIRSALAYPAILAVVGTGTIAMMVGVVIPRFSAVLADLGQSLPRSTQLVMAIASLVRAAALPAALFGVAAIAAWRAWTSTVDGRRNWHAFLLRVPIVGTVRAAASSSRTALTLASLLETGVPLRQTIRLAARASGDAAIGERVLDAGARIETGQRIAAALGDTQAITPLAVRLAHAGEESGRLVPLLKHAAQLERQRSDRIVRTFVRLLEPALILCFAGVVAFLAGALLQAVYAVRPTP
ncbi:MAG TPA: type II secretion system F family protein [Gemmatimonadaceae bacterium]|nr:type II secretion system F family protein [Gemmatimonadaceae bacterium]